MDLTESIAPRSDQVNADDLVGGPMTVTIREVVKGKAEQPFDFLLAESDRAFRPGVTMRRIIVAAWGPDTKDYAGRRLTLYRDPSIKFGGTTVGGIRISHMSHITEPLNERLQVTRGKREMFTVQPLPDAPAAPKAEPLTADAIACCVDLTQLGKWWKGHPDQRAEIESRVAEIKAADETTEEPA